MARIEGVYLPLNKRIEYALPYIFGIGLKTAQVILDDLSIDFSKRVKDLTDEEITRIQQQITANYVVEGELRKDIRNDIRRLQEIRSYRGERHRKGLPTRGQRTKTNARTRKGPRKAGSQITLKKIAKK